MSAATLTRSRAVLALLCALSSSAHGQIPTFAFPGDGPFDALGSSVAVVGDLDGDGRADWIAGAPAADLGGTDSGLARIWSAADGTTLLTLRGDSPFDAFGVSVDGAGDVDGDGIPDLIVGAWLDDPNGTNSGSARVFSGAGGSTLVSLAGAAPHAHFGRSVAGAGDVDVDGFPDLAVGAPGSGGAGPNAGSAFVYSGASGALLSAYHGTGAGDSLGFALASAGDLDGDARPDLIVGAPLANVAGFDSGLVRAYSGASGSILLDVPGQATGHFLGESVDLVGDVNSDGIGDLVASVHGTGQARILSGATAATLVVISGAAQVQPSVAGLGDYDGDGVPDVIVAGADGTYAFVRSGSSGALLATISVPAYATSVTLAVGGGGDADANGVPDPLVGTPIPPAPYSSYTGSGSDDSPGYLLVYAGQAPCLPTLYTFGSAVAGEATGLSVGPAGDLDGDGIGDVLYGSPHKPSGVGPFPPGRVTARSGATGGILFDVSGTLPGDTLGTAVASIGDVDGDFVPDIASSAPGNLYPPTDTGTVRVYSGATSASLMILAGAASQYFGASVAGVGDVDGDGIGDLLVGATEPYYPSYTYGGPGRAILYSGATGLLLLELPGDVVGSYQGASVAGAGDIDLDGVPDLLVGAPGTDSGLQVSGKVRAYSGASGAVLFTAYADGLSHKFGASVSSAGDVNADGVADLVAGAPDAHNYYGLARVYSGADGSVLLTVDGDSWLDSLGRSVGAAGDMDLDGFGDVLIGAPGADGPAGSNVGSAVGYSGRTGQLLWLCTGSTPQGYFGIAAAAAGDMDGDGRSELVIGAPGLSTAAGQVWVLAGSAGGLSGTPLALSIAAGGTQTLSLDAGESHGGELYLLLGTAGSTSPGIALGALVLPLELDAYLLYTLAHPNKPPLSGSLGALGAASGAAFASFALPPGTSAALAGLVLHHAYVVLDASGVAFASNPATLFLQ